jgi:thymidylate kinase
MIYLMGTDGSGKTTLANNIVEKFRLDGKKIKYLYVRHKPILLFPLKWISRQFIFKNDSEFKNYEKYSDKKSGFSTYHPVIAKVYSTVWIIDYLLYYFLKVRLACLFSKQIILDRYVADVAVNISIAIGLDKNQMFRLIHFLHFFFPKPDKSFFINVSEGEAYSRKDDIPSLQYLIERKEKYFLLRSFYNFKILDGHLQKEKLVSSLIKQLEME